MEDEEVEHKNQADQENIRLNNQSRISPTNDEEMSHVHNLNDDNSLSDDR